MTADEEPPQQQGHIVGELGFEVSRVGDEMHGFAAVIPEMYVPETTSIRASIFAIWVDLVAGYLAIDVFSPRVPTTLELDVHLHQDAHEPTGIHAVGRILKAGSTVIVVAVDFADENGRNIGFGTASFMAVPDPSVMMPAEHLVRRAATRSLGRLRVSFAERARCERVRPGEAVLARSEDGLNSANTINGGLMALAVEEAALSAAPATILSSLSLRYLRAVRVGPAVATAVVRDGLGRVEVRDSGSDDRLGVYAITSSRPAMAGARREAAA